MRFFYENSQTNAVLGRENEESQTHMLLSNSIDFSIVYCNFTTFNFTDDFTVLFFLLVLISLCCFLENTSFLLRNLLWNHRLKHIFNSLCVNVRYISYGPLPIQPLSPSCCSVQFMGSFTLLHYFNSYPHGYWRI